MFKLSASHHLFSLFACSAILLPVHPSLQYVLKSSGVPSEIIAFILFLPALYCLLTRSVFNEQVIFVIVPFVAYACWILLRGVFSPALGEVHFYASIRGVMILVSFATLCALIGAQDRRWASRTIFLMGLSALAHLWYLIISGSELGSVGGFRSLSLNTEWANYQSTSFYIGFAGVFMACVALTKRGVFVWMGIVGALFVLATMAMVGARAPIVAVFASTFVIWLIKEQGRSYVFSLLVIAAFFVVLLFDFAGLVSQLSVVQRFVSLFEEGDSSRRLSLFSSAIEMWLQSPINFLFGGGIGAFPYYIGEPPEDGWYPHNFILESLSEAGLIAGLMLFAIGIVLMIRLFRIRSEVDLETVYFGALALYALVAFQFMGGLQTLWIPGFFVALFLFNKLHSRP